MTFSPVSIAVLKANGWNTDEYWNDGHGDEQAFVFDKLMDWRSQTGGDVLLLGGDIHLGGYTEIFQTGNSVPVLRQFVTSQINSDPVPLNFFGFLLQIAAISSNLENGYSFLHHDFTYKSNYGIVNADLVGGFSVITKYLRAATPGEAPQSVFSSL